MNGFIFGGDTGIASPEELTRRRELVRALKLRSVGTLPRNQWEGLSGLVQAIGGRIAENRLDQLEGAGRKGADEVFASYLRSGLNTAPPADLISNPWLSKTQREYLQRYHPQQSKTTAYTDSEG